MAEKAAVFAKTSEPKQQSSSLCKQESDVNNSGSPAERILHLQRTAGNQAVQRLIRSGVLQAKLKIGQPNDMYEQEADRVAEQVMRMPQPKVQRKCARCNKDEKKVLQAKKLPGKVSVTQEQDVPLIVHDVLRSPGRPLDTETRAFMEPRFGYDFSQVRVHTDSKAVQMNRDLQAQAFTYNQDIYYGGGKAPDKNELTAHELTHVVQQTGGVQTKKVPEQPSVQLKCLACEKKKAEIQRSPEISVSMPGIQRWSLFGDNEDKNESDSSGGGILSWVEEKANEVVNSITEAGGEAVDWAKQQAGAVIQSGDGAGQKGADNNISGTSFSPAALAAAKQLAGKLKCKLSIGQDGITLGCGRIKLTDPQEEKVLEFPKLSKIKNLKDFIIAGVKIEPELGLDIGPSLWLSVGSITLNDVLIRIDPLHDTYIGQGQVNVPIGSHIVVEVVGKISAGATLSIPVEGISIPIKGFAEGGLRGEGIGSTIFNFQEIVRLSYIQDKFMFDLDSKIKAGFKVQFNVTPFLNVQYKIAEREKRLCEFTAPFWTWEIWIKAEELSIPISINPSKGDKPVTVGPITKQVISGEDIEGDLSRNLPGLQGKCTKFCDLIEGIGDPSQLIVAQSSIGQGQVFSTDKDKILKALSNAAAGVCGKKKEAPAPVGACPVPPPLPVILLLPSLKSDDLSLYAAWLDKGPLQHRVGRPRDTNQLSRWNALMPGRVPISTKQRAERLGLNMDDIIRPYWSKSHVLGDRMVVDHIVEMQVTPIGRETQFDLLPNYRLMETGENSSVGAELVANIRKMREALESRGGSIWRDCDLTFDKVSAAGRKTPSTWTQEELQAGRQLDAYERLGKPPRPPKI